MRKYIACVERTMRVMFTSRKPSFSSFTSFCHFCTSSFLWASLERHVCREDFSEEATDLSLAALEHTNMQDLKILTGRNPVKDWKIFEFAVDGRALTLCYILGVPQGQHQLMEGLSGFSNAKARLLRRWGEAIAWQRWHDHVEGLASKFACSMACQGHRYEKCYLQETWACPELQSKSLCGSNPLSWRLRIASEHHSKIHSKLALAIQAFRFQNDK